MEDQQFEDPESQQLFLQCLTSVWHRDIRVFARRFKEYSNEAHLSAVKAAIQYSETLLQNQDDFSPVEPSDEEDKYSTLQNPAKTPIVSKDFLRAPPHCPIIHWASQMCNNPQLCFCPCSSHSRPWREKNNIFIDDDHGCKATAMTPQELLKHLKTEVDSTHRAILVYLQILNSFSRGHARQDPGVNSKKKPDSDEEEKEDKEREEEEEEVAAALDSNDVSCEQVDTYACIHAKQGIETQIASDKHKDPVSKVTDGCESAKKVLDDIEKDDTDVTGQKEVMGGSVQVENQFSHDNIDENANDQSKHQLDPKIGTENPEGPKSKCKDGGDTSINVPGDNVGTDVISRQEGASDEKSDESPVLPSSNAPGSGKALQLNNFWNKMNNKKKRKRKKREKTKKKKKKKKKSKRNHDKLIPTAKNRSGKLQVRVAGQLLYHDVFSTYMHHFVQDDPHSLKDVIQDIMNTSSSLPKRCTTGPLAQLDSMVSSWTTNGKATTAGSLLVFEDNVGEDGFLPSPLSK